MNNNRLSGSIPKEIADLKLLEVLDLSHNNLSGRVPPEIAVMPSLKCLLLCGNDDLKGDFPPVISMLEYLLETECGQHIKLIVAGAKEYIQRTGCCIKWYILNQLKGCFGISNFLKNQHGRYFLHANGKSICQNISSANGRRLLSKETSNLAARPPTKLSQQNSPTVLRSGAYPVTLKKAIAPTKNSSSAISKEHPKEKGGLFVALIIIIVIIVFVSLCCALMVLRRYCGAKKARAQNAALLNRLSKVFVTGVPKLNSAELHTACEEFSNIIDTGTGHLVFKGILSSGVEIAVISTSIRSLEQWSNNAEREFQRKMNIFSKINHKNFINLLGHCEEDDPFVRMMVFEYAPNGNLYEHLHVKEMDHLDWAHRMRIIMGTCYCLEHMHHELNPPVVHPYLQSDAILLTEDYAAKLVDASFWGDIVEKAKISEDEESEPLHSNSGPTMEDNVYSLGILLLEIISTKSLNSQAMEYLSNKETYSKLLDPTLKSFKTNELEVICEVIRECIDDDPRRRPTVKEITSKLQAVIKISPEAATSRNSPLWWAELELLECG